MITVARCQVLVHIKRESRYGTITLMEEKTTPICILATIMSPVAERESCEGAKSIQHTITAAAVSEMTSETQRQSASMVAEKRRRGGRVRTEGHIAGSARRIPASIADRAQQELGDRARC